MGRWSAAFGLVVLAASLSACASTPWWYHTGTSTCGVPAMVRAGGRVIPLGNCASSFVVPAAKVTVRVGEEIDVHMTQAPAGPSGKRLLPESPLPRSSAPHILRRTAISPDAATGTYLAARPGHAKLLTRTGCYVPATGRDVPGCAVLDVTVRP